MGDWYDIKKCKQDSILILLFLPSFFGTTEGTFQHALVKLVHGATDIGVWCRAI